MSKQKHPIQPLFLDDNKILRFKENKIVSFLLDNGGIDLNKIARLNFDKEDKQQFAQLIGYSLSGYSELSYVDDDSYCTANNMHKLNLDEGSARITYLEKLISSLRKQLREPIAELFEIHPDDLKED